MMIQRILVLALVLVSQASFAEVYDCYMNPNKKLDANNHFGSIEILKSDQGLVANLYNWGGGKLFFYNLGVKVPTANQIIVDFADRKFATPIFLTRKGNSDSWTYQYQNLAEKRSEVCYLRP